MECVKCRKELINKQKKFCSVSCQLKIWNKNNPKYIIEKNGIGTIAKSGVRRVAQAANCRGRGFA